MYAFVHGPGCKETETAAMKALVTGATGFVGREMVRRLRDPVVLSRDPQRAERELGVETQGWDPLADLPPVDAFRGVDTVFHLAGEPVAEGRWTQVKKERIRASRVIGTRNLVDRLRVLLDPPKTLISASAIGFYGSRGDEWLEETDGPSGSFLGQVGQDWERAALAAQGIGVRVVTPRIGIVLGRGGGGLVSMLPPFRLGLGGRLGHGRQWMSWIHLQDLVELLLFTAGNPDFRGPVNAVAPNPVTNREFTRELSATLHRPAILPVPALALRLALGEFSTVLLESQRVVPRVAIENGFGFRYPDLKMCLHQILKTSGCSTPP